MKASFYSGTTLSPEFDAPFPTQSEPSTESSEIIVTGYDQAADEETFEISGKNQNALHFHGIDELSERPELAKLIGEFDVSDEYGLVYNAVANLVDVNDRIAAEIAEQHEEITNRQETTMLRAMHHTVTTLFTQMKLGRMRPNSLEGDLKLNDAVKAVLQMERVVRENRQLSNVAVESQPHIVVAEKKELTAEEKHTSRLFGKLVQKIFSYKNISLKELFESLPRSSEIPTSTTQTLTTRAIEATGITRP